MKSLKVKLNDYLKINYFYDAFKRASKHKRYNKEVLLFELNLENNLYKLIEEISNDTYKLGPYTAFTIYEPKIRIIRKLPFRDRVVHQWYIEEFIKPYFVKRFISDSYACLVNKGVHKCVYKIKKMLNKNDYVIKLDIKKYFDNIDPSILKMIMLNKIKDERLRSFTNLLIGDASLPIGNYTSQFFGNIYLNEIDYYIKYVLKVKRYVRYLDDFCLLVDRKEAKIIYNKIEKFLNEKLNLELNKKSCYFPCCKGISFCGYVIYKDYLLIKKSNIKKISKRIKYNKNILINYNGYLRHSKSVDRVFNFYD